MTITSEPVGQVAVLAADSAALLDPRLTAAGFLSARSGLRPYTLDHLPLMCDITWVPPVGDSHSRRSDQWFRGHRSTLRHVDHDGPSGIPKNHHDPFGPLAPSRRVAWDDTANPRMDAQPNPRDIAQYSGWR